ncbi:MAG: sn-glycerol-1-phosphate dehydrogenase [Oscillospiraceae bacterium]|nr:sn-glycerol-1-phosphate dehydrogenase [Oscillospiraceae bacterium]
MIELNNLAGPCSCGHNHEVITAHIDTDKGAAERMPEKLKESGFSKVWMVCDTNTYAAAGEKIEALLCKAEIFAGKTLLSHEHIMADEYSVELTESSINNYDLLLAVGSGTIHDITRYVAFQHNTPFVSFPTAASVDGFVSSVAAMEFGGLKVTLSSRSPIMLFAEPEVLKEAPMDLTCAGVGDILGKYTSLADWRMAHLITGEHFCQRIYDLVLKATEIVHANIAGLSAGNLTAFQGLLDGLIISGLAMQMMGHSRPASSGEHHISHFWEMGMVEGVDPNALHGEKVGMNELRLLKLYKSADWDKLLALPIKLRDIKPDIRLAYKDLADEIIELNTPDSADAIDPELVKKNLEEVKAIYAALPDSDELMELMAGIGCTVAPETLSCSEEAMQYSIDYACYVRNKLTLLRLLRIVER